MAQFLGTSGMLAAILFPPLAAALALAGCGTEAPVAASPPAPAAAPTAPVVAPVASVVQTPEPVAAVEAGVPIEPTPAVAAEPPPAVAATPGAEETPPILATHQALLMHQGALVLAADPSLAWASGSSKLDPIDDGYKLDREVALDRLPTSLQTIIGARYAVYSAAGTRCDAQVAGVSLYTEETGQHFTESDEPPTLAGMHEMAKALNSNAYVLQAKLAVAGDCSPVWARSAELPPPIVFTRGGDDPSLRPRVLKHMKTLRGIRAMGSERRAYLRDADAEERRQALAWDAFLDAQLKLIRWDEIDGPRSFVTAQVTHEDGCGGFNPDPVTMLFELNGDRLTPHTDPGFLNPIALMDVDRDGHLEAVTDNATHLETRGSQPLAFRYSFPSIFCPC